MSSITASNPARLQGRTLLAGRILYGLLFLLCLSIFAISQGFKFVQGTSACDSIYNAGWAAQGAWCAEWFAAIDELGINAVVFESYFLVLRLVAALPYMAFSLLLVRRRGHELRVLLLAGFLLVLGVAGPWFTPFWGWAGGWFGDYSAAPALAVLPRFLTFLMFGGLLLFAFLFPDGRFVPGWSRRIAGVGLIVVIGEAFFPDTSLAVSNWPVPLNPLIPLALVGGALGAAMFRYRNDATAVQRQQMKWVTLGFFLMTFNYLLDYTVFNIYEAFTGQYPLANGWQAVFWELGQDTLWYASQFIFALCLGYAIFRRRLWDVDPILNRTLVYGSLTALIITLYVLIVGGLGALFQTRTNTISGLVATGIIAVLFQPLRERLQRAVNRLLYGERDDPAAVLTQLAHHLQMADAPGAILPNLVRTIARTLKIPYAAIRLSAADGEIEEAAAWGQASEDVETAPLTYQQKILGQLVVAPRGPGERFNRRERELLATIAALTATTVRAVQLSNELRDSRRRIVTAREEERRRLRRDLHDGLGPQLASQTLGMEAVDQLIATNPQKAHELLASLKTQAQEAILDVRRLVYNLRPPALDDLGLVGALRQSASRYEKGELRFSFDVDDSLPDLPAAVETAAYRIAQEAMTNVVRHAGATKCTMRLHVLDHHFVVEVRDDGKGLPEEVHSGVGLQAMRERTAELNGQCVIESIQGGGTQVQARLPLEATDG